MEKTIQTETMREIGSRLDVRIFRNNVGNGFFGDIVSVGKYAILKNYRRVQFGLCKGSGDLIGLKCVTITPEMVGRKIAVFVSIEEKDENKKPTPAQKNWRNMVINFGGIAGIAYNVIDAQRIIGEPGTI